MTKALRLFLGAYREMRSSSVSDVENAVRAIETLAKCDFAGWTFEVREPNRDGLLRVEVINGGGLVLDTKWVRKDNPIGIIDVAAEMFARAYAKERYS